MTTDRKRRSLHFETSDDAWEDIRRLRDADIVVIGAWSAGKIVQHLADTINYSIDGFPEHVMKGIGPPLHPRIADRMLKKGVRAGIQLPDAFEVLLPDEGIDLDLAMDNFQAALARMQTERMESRSPLLGEMNHERWLQGHCRHAELQLSFIM